MLLDEVFGEDNQCGTIQCQKTTGAGSPSVRTVVLASVVDQVLWYAKKRDQVKYRQLFSTKTLGEAGTTQYINVRDLEEQSDSRITKEQARAFDMANARYKIFAADNLTSQSPSNTTGFKFTVDGKEFRPGQGYWKTTERGLVRLRASMRLKAIGNSLMYRRYLEDFAVSPLNNIWQDVFFTGFTDEKLYVVQTAVDIVRRCIQMTSDPGDLVLDPTCGSGTTAYAAEQWGRRWITIDTSRVALALARARIMGARYPFYLLADSREGQTKEAEITRIAPSSQAVHGNIRHGFVYERVPHVTLKSIANNAEIDVIWETWQATLEPVRERLNASLKKQWQEWEIPREADSKWPEPTKRLHADWWLARIARQRDIDASIAAKAESEYLYDKPYADNRRVRVAGPFTVESLSPHRVLGVDENDELIDPNKRVDGEWAGEYGEKQSFPHMILENLKTAGVQQAQKDDKIVFTSLTPWPGALICGEGRYREGTAEMGPEKRAAIFIGPEFGTVTRPDLVAAAKEAGDSDFDVLIACAFNYEAHATEFGKLGRIPVLKARMNADLHMSEELKNTGKGNLFVIFGEPDITLLPESDGRIRVKVNGVDVFDPSSGEVRSDGADGIACWFIDTDYNEESFFVRHAYFLGANDPYGALKTTLRAEINEEAWATLHSDASRPFKKPKSGRIAVKVINHLGDEVMKVFRVTD
jgi:adenine-specific DNA-methyltransferase